MSMVEAIPPPKRSSGDATQCGSPNRCEPILVGDLGPDRPINVIPTVNTLLLPLRAQLPYFFPLEVALAILNLRQYFWP
jgi:hypothetical protein